MPENVVETDRVQLKLPRSLIEQLELLGQTGLFGAQLGDVIGTILANEIRRMIVTGEFSTLRDRVRAYPAKAEDGSKKEGKE